MTRFHAILRDETNCEFSVTINAPTRIKAYDILTEDYPESHVTELLDPQQVEDRENARYSRAQQEYDDEWS